MKRTVSLLAAAALAAGTAWGTDCELTINEDFNAGSITGDGRLAIEAALIFHPTYTSDKGVVARTYEFWMHYGLVGDSVTNSVKLGTYAMSAGYYKNNTYRSAYQWFSDEDTPDDFRYFPIPGYNFTQDVWYQIAYSNTTYRLGSGTLYSPPPANQDCSAVSAVHVINGQLSPSTPFDTHPEWGYAITGLGTAKNETALVFTNTAAAMTFRPAAYLTDVQFLVVGGGGGGGGDAVTSTSGNRGGAGGGGGGVVTGVVDRIFSSADITITVGAGGEGGTAGVDPDGSTSTAAAGGAKSAGKASTIQLRDDTITGNGGGRDLGKNKQGGSGGSRAGNRYNQTSLGEPTRGTITVNAANRVHGVALGNKGGASVNSSSYAYASGGGGGATKAGGKPSSATKGGAGGEGLASDITGTTDVYGSGGGGGVASASGIGGAAGTNAGNGHQAAKAKGEDALPNRGGGGGGAGMQANGGNGGSGIVVLRYAFANGKVPVPTIAPKEYTGEAQTADIEDTYAYTVDENNGGIDVGSYNVVLTTTPIFNWLGDGIADTVTLSFAISQATNVWTTEPSITKASWTAGVDEPGVLTNGVTRFGTVSAIITKDGGEAEAFDGTLPTEAGEYVIAYTASAGTANYAAPETTTKTVSFTIFSADAIPPYEITIGTLSVGTDRMLSIPYSLSCDVTTAKTADLYVRYALDGDTTTNTAQIATGVALGGGNGTGTVADLKPGATYWVDVYAEVDDETSAPTALASVTVPGPASDLAASATFTPIPMEFIISGSVTPGLGTTTVTVKWSLNNANSYDETATYTFALGDDGTFSTKIPHSALTDTLTWEVSAANTVTTATWGEQTFADLAPISDTTVCRDWGRVTYTWTGLGGDNLWTNVLNWSGTNTTFDTPECYGYPGLKFGYYWDTIVFTNDAVVDLCGGTYGLRDFDNGENVNLLFDQNICVTLRNGTLDIHGDAPVFGANGTTVTFDSVKIISDEPASTFTVGIVQGATLCFAGTSTAVWKWKPTKSSVNYLVKDGTTSSRYESPTISTTTFTTISNAIWSITAGNVSAGTGYVTYFRNGADRQAQLKTGTGQSIDLRNTYDIVIPKEGLALPSIEAGLIENDANAATFRVDVTDYGKKARIPLVKFTNTTATNQANNNTRVTSQISGEKLVVQAVSGGRDVTERHNARLEWDNATQTIYFAQDYSAGTILFLQ